MIRRFRSCSRSGLLSRTLRAALLRVAAATALVVPFAPQAAAEQADRLQPTTVEADRMQYEEATKTNVFTGNVVLMRGTIRITSDRMVLRQDADAFQYGTATGRPATFRQKRDGIDEWIEGYAEELEYDGRKETVRLLRSAKVRRTQGARVMDEIEGGLIVYDLRTEQFAVDGSPAGTPSGGRVRVTIQPRDDAASPSSPPKPAPKPAPKPSPPQGSGVTLQPAERPAAAGTR